jgi:ligand-binding sensor domain-containing protein
MKITHLITICLCLILQYTIAQQYSFTSYSLDNGLPQSEIFAICKDSNGFIWVGTNGGGLARLDGKHFKTFNRKHGLGSDIVRNI